MAGLMIVGLLLLSFWFAWLSLRWKCRAIEWEQKYHIAKCDVSSFGNRLKSKDGAIQSARDRIKTLEHEAARQKEMREHYEQLYLTTDARVNELTGRLAKIRDFVGGE